MGRMATCVHAAGQLAARVLVLGLVVGAPAATPSTAIDAKAIVDRVDRLFRGDSSEGEMTMEVVTRRWTRMLTLRAWSEGTEKALVKVLSPREGGWRRHLDGR
jgi:hypothetical protein